MRTIDGGQPITGVDSPLFASLRRTSVEARARAMAAGRDWFRIVNRADRGGTSFAEVYIYDEIGYYGITAGQFVAELGELDVDEIDLHVNSPGGEVWDGIAIYNALVNHRAKVTAYVDGIAASAASVIIMAGDDRCMAQGAQLMIHDAWGLCVGNAQDMQAMGDRLDAESNNIAGFYAQRSGGSVASWRKAMLAETWYNAAEAVAAGLADRVAKTERRGDDDDGSPADRWDLSVFGFRYEGRDKAPAPTPAGGVYPDPRAPVLRPAAGIGEDDRPPAGPGPHTNPPPAQPPVEVPPDDGEPDEDELELAGAIAACFVSSVQAAAAEDDFLIDGDMLRDVIGHEASHRPADPAPARVDTPPTAGELAAADIITEALLEALA